MLRRRVSKEKKAQTIIEYTMILGVIAMILFAMNTMVKRGIQGMIKVVADQVGNQESAEQRFDDTGHMETSSAHIRADLDKVTGEFGGVTTYIYGDVTETGSTTVTNLGFTEEN